MANSDNPATGALFERTAQAYFKSQNIELERPFSITIGAASISKRHKYDLGSNNPPILVECKAHTWTAGGNAPSAKMSVWNEAMYYFHIAPPRFRCVLFVIKNVNHGRSLAQYYIDRYEYLIPTGVEILEYDPTSCQAIRVHPQ